MTLFWAICIVNNFCLFSVYHKLQILPPVFYDPKFHLLRGFENNNVNKQTHDESTFDIMNVTECYCKIGSVSFLPGIE